jgi:integrase
MMISLGRNQQPGDPTLTAFLDAIYLPSRIAVSEGWADQLRIAIGRLEEWHGGEVHVSQLSEPFLRGFLSSYAEHQAAGTVNGKRGALLALWQCAWEEGLVEQPPKRTQVRRVQSDERVPEAWTADEMGAILRACKTCRGEIGGIRASDWWRSMLLVAYDTGERRKALLATMPKQIDMVKEHIVFRNTKTKRQRWCKLAPETIGALRLVYAPTFAVVWPWEGSLKALHDRLCVILRRAGVRFGRDAGGVWHKFRRTSGSLVEMAGGDGAKHLGNTRAVFERHYKDPRFFHSSVALLPRPF